MTRWTWIATTLLAALAACTAASPGHRDDPDGESLTVSVSESDPDLFLETAEPQPAATSLLIPAPPEAAMVQDGGGGALADERARRELLAQKTHVLVESYLENARALEEQLRFDDAERELEKARSLDPANRIVLDYLAQIRALSGKPEGEAALLRQSARERYLAHRQQLRTLALNDLQNARQAMEAEDFGTAVTLSRGVVNRISWTADSVDWSDVEPEARALLAEAEAAYEQQDEVVRRRMQEEAYRRLATEQSQQALQDDERVRTMLISATRAFDEADYETAEDLARTVLDLDQHDPQALTILEAARDASRELADRIFIQRRREEFNRWRNSMETVRIPTAAIMTDPSAAHWAEINATRGSRRSLGLPEIDPEELELRARISEERMDVDFTDAEIREVADAIYFATQIPVSVDPEIAQELDDNAEYVNLSGLRDVTVESLLNLVTESVGDELAWHVRRGRAYITRKDKASGKPLPLVHNIQDLTFKVTDFKGTNIRDIALPGEAGDDAETTIFNSELEQTTKIESEEVLNLVREHVATEDWDNGTYSIDFADNDNLLVVHTPEVQAEVAEFLDDMRAFSSSMVTLESRFFAISDSFIEEIGTDLRGLDPEGDFADNFELTAAGTTGNPTQGLDNLGNGTGNPNAGVFFDDVDQVYAASSENFFTNPLGDLLSTIGGGAFQFTILDDTQVNIVMNLVSKTESATEITAPTVSVYNSQRSFVTVVNQVSFVQGYEVDVATSAQIADPVVGVVQEGIVLDVRPTISYDRQYITLDVQTTVAELTRPFRQISTLLGPNGSPVTFSIPELTVQDAQTTVVVPDGGAVVLGGFKHVRYKNRTAESPWLADIPLLGFFFREKGLVDEVTDLIIVIRATITDFGHLREMPAEAR